MSKTDRSTVAYTADGPWNIQEPHGSRHPSNGEYRRQSRKDHRSPYSSSRSPSRVRSGSRTRLQRGHRSSSRSPKHSRGDSPKRCPRGLAIERGSLHDDRQSHAIRESEAYHFSSLNHDRHAALSSPSHRQEAPQQLLTKQPYLNRRPAAELPRLRKGKDDSRPVILENLTRSRGGEQYFRICDTTDRITVPQQQLSTAQCTIGPANNENASVIATAAGVVDPYQMKWRGREGAIAQLAGQGHAKGYEHGCGTGSAQWTGQQVGTSEGILPISSSRRSIDTRGPSGHRGHCSVLSAQGESHSGRDRCNQTERGTAERPERRAGRNAQPPLPCRLPQITEPAAGTGEILFNGAERNMDPSAANLLPLTSSVHAAAEGMDVTSSFDDDRRKSPPSLALHLPSAGLQEPCGTMLKSSNEALTTALSWTALEAGQELCLPSRQNAVTVRGRFGKGRLSSIRHAPMEHSGPCNGSEIFGNPRTPELDYVKAGADCNGSKVTVNATAAGTTAHGSACINPTMQMGDPDRKRNSVVAMETASNPAATAVQRVLGEAPRNPDGGIGPLAACEPPPSSPACNAAMEVTCPAVLSGSHLRPGIAWDPNAGTADRSLKPAGHADDETGMGRAHGTGRARDGGSGDGGGGNMSSSTPVDAINWITSTVEVASMLAPAMAAALQNDDAHEVVDAEDWRGLPSPFKIATVSRNGNGEGDALDAYYVAHPADMVVAGAGTAATTVGTRTSHGKTAVAGASIPMTVTITDFSADELLGPTEASGDAEGDIATLHGSTALVRTEMRRRASSGERSRSSSGNGRSGGGTDLSTHMQPSDNSPRVKRVSASDIVNRLKRNFPTTIVAPGFNDCPVVCDVDEELEDGGHVSKHFLMTGETVFKAGEEPIPLEAAAVIEPADEGTTSEFRRQELDVEVDLTQTSHDLGSDTLPLGPQEVQEHHLHLQGDEAAAANTIQSARITSGFGQEYDAGRGTCDLLPQGVVPLSLGLEPGLHMRLPFAAAVSSSMLDVLSLGVCALSPRPPPRPESPLPRQQQGRSSASDLGLLVCTTGGCTAARSEGSPLRQALTTAVSPTSTEHQRPSPLSSPCVDLEAERSRDVLPQALLAQGEPDSRCGQKRAVNTDDGQGTIGATAQRRRVDSADGTEGGAVMADDLRRLGSRCQDKEQFAALDALGAVLHESGDCRMPEEGSECRAQEGGYAEEDIVNRGGPVGDVEELLSAARPKTAVERTQGTAALDMETRSAREYLEPVRDTIVDFGGCEGGNSDSGDSSDEDAACVTEKVHRPRGRPRRRLGLQLPRPFCSLPQRLGRKPRLTIDTQMLGDLLGELPGHDSKIYMQVELDGEVLCTRLEASCLPWSCCKVATLSSPYLEELAANKIMLGWAKAGHQSDAALKLRLLSSMEEANHNSASAPALPRSCRSEMGRRSRQGPEEQINQGYQEKSEEGDPAICNEPVGMSAEPEENEAAFSVSRRSSARPQKQRMSSQSRPHPSRSRSWSHSKQPLAHGGEERRVSEPDSTRTFAVLPAATPRPSSTTVSAQPLLGTSTTAAGTAAPEGYLLQPLQGLNAPGVTASPGPHLALAADGYDTRGIETVAVISSPPVAAVMADAAVDVNEPLVFPTSCAKSCSSDILQDIAAHTRELHSCHVLNLDGAPVTEAPKSGNSHPTHEHCEADDRVLPPSAASKPEQLECGALSPRFEPSGQDVPQDPPPCAPRSSDPSPRPLLPMVTHLHQRQGQQSLSQPQRMQVFSTEPYQDALTALTTLIDPRAARIAAGMIQLVHIATDNRDYPDNLAPGLPINNDAQGARATCEGGLVLRSSSHSSAPPCNLANAVALDGAGTVRQTMSPAHARCHPDDGERHVPIRMTLPAASPEKAASGSGVAAQDLLPAAPPPELQVGRPAATATATSGTVVTTETEALAAAAVAEPTAVPAAREPLPCPTPGLSGSSLLDLYEHGLTQLQQEGELTRARGIVPAPIPQTAPLRAMLEQIRIQSDLLLLEGDSDDMGLRAAVYIALQSLHLPVANLIKRRNQAASLVAAVGTAAAIPTPVVFASNIGAGSSRAPPVAPTANPSEAVHITGPGRGVQPVQALPGAEVSGTSLRLDLRSRAPAPSLLRNQVVSDRRLGLEDVRPRYPEGLPSQQAASDMGCVREVLEAVLAQDTVAAAAEVPRRSTAVEQCTARGPPLALLVPQSSMPSSQQLHMGLPFPSMRVSPMSPVFPRNNVGTTLAVVAAGGMNASLTAAAVPAEVRREKRVRQPSQLAAAAKNVTEMYVRRAPSSRAAAAKASARINRVATDQLRSTPSGGDNDETRTSINANQHGGNDDIPEHDPLEPVEKPAKRPRRTTGALSVEEGDTRRGECSYSVHHGLGGSAHGAFGSDAAAEAPAGALTRFSIPAALERTIRAKATANSGQQLAHLLHLPLLIPRPPLPRSSVQHPQERQRQQRQVDLEELLLSPQQLHERVQPPGGGSYPPLTDGPLYTLGGNIFKDGLLYVGKRTSRGLCLFTKANLSRAQRDPTLSALLSVTQRCHLCEGQMLAADCEWCGKRTVCERCHRAHFSSFAYWELVQKCPRCRGCCYCRFCADRYRQLVPRMSIMWEARKDMAHHALRFITGTGNGVARDGSAVAASAATANLDDDSNENGKVNGSSVRGGVLGAYLEAERAELLAEGRNRKGALRQQQQQQLELDEVEGVVEFKRAINQRSLCDLCATSLPAMHRACLSCKKEYCLSCCRELRRHCHQQQQQPVATGPQVAPTNIIGPLRCPVPECGHHTRLRTYLPSPMRNVLKQLHQEWGNMAAASGSQLAPSQWDPALIVVSEANLRPEQFGGPEVARRAAEAALAVMDRLRPKMGSRSTCGAAAGQEQDQNENDPVVVAGITRHRAGQPLPAGHVAAWGRYVLPQEDVRLASPRPDDGPDHSPRHIFTPASADLKPTSSRFVAYTLLFQQRWRRREPVVVRDCRGPDPHIWKPENFQKAVRRGLNGIAFSDGAGGAAGQLGRTGRGGGRGSKRGRSSGGRARGGGPGERVTASVLRVIDCADSFRVLEDMDESRFFKLYDEPYDKITQPYMLKLKDYPPAANFHNVLPEHFKDFVESLPLPFMTRPDEAPLNLATWMAPGAVPTDLGPKAYIAFGTPEECEEPVERDSVTKLHIDMSDAVNVLNNIRPQKAVASGPKSGGAGFGESCSTESWQQQQHHHQRLRPRCGDELPVLPGYSGAGAVWDIWAPGQETQGLRSYLTAHKSEFVHCGEVLTEVEDAVFDQSFFLNRMHRDRLWELHRVASWHFEQYEHEAVFIPAGCPHQVRNLTSCIKTAVDFVSPEAVDESLAMAARLRLMPRNPFAEGYHPANDVHSDRLQGLLISLSAAVENYRILNPGSYRANSQPSLASRNETAISSGRRAGVGRSATALLEEGPSDLLPPAAPAATAAAAGAAGGVGVRKRFRTQAGLGSEVAERQPSSGPRMVRRRMNGTGGGSGSNDSSISTGGGSKPVPVKTRGRRQGQPSKARGGVRVRGRRRVVPRRRRLSPLSEGSDAEEEPSESSEPLPGKSGDDGTQEEYETAEEYS